MAALNRRQIAEWVAYSNLCPFGDERADYRSATATFWLRGAWAAEDDGMQPMDFMPKFEGSGVKTEAEMIRDEILESL